MEGTLYPSATEIEFNNVTGGVVAKNTNPVTAIGTCVPAHNYWIIEETAIVCGIDGGKAMFKEKQSFTLFFRAFMNFITQRNGRSKSGGEKEKK
ncbi:hypothetical protein Tco_1222054 [Tanacetum coccineum]